ncbi:MAG: hypothetical protein HKM04_05135 [Legionellales bacterium]|nr:hypothetical protein [Legionellales bacterium]
MKDTHANETPFDKRQETEIIIIEQTDNRPNGKPKKKFAFHSNPTFNSDYRANTKYEFDVPSIRPVYYDPVLFTPMPKSIADAAADDGDQYELLVLNEIGILQQLRKLTNNRHSASPEPRRSNGNEQTATSPNSSASDDEDILFRSNTAEKNESFFEKNFMNYIDSEIEYEHSDSGETKDEIPESDSFFLGNADNFHEAVSPHPTKEELDHFHQALFDVATEYANIGNVGSLLSSLFKENKTTLLLRWLEQGRIMQYRAIQFRLAQLHAILDDGCYLHSMSSLPTPDDLKNYYRHSYIRIGDPVGLIRDDAKAKNSASLLFYVTPSGLLAEVQLINVAEFEKKFYKIGLKQNEKIHISANQLKSLITDNGGHSLETPQQLIQSFGREGIIIYLNQSTRYNFLQCIANENDVPRDSNDKIIESFFDSPPESWNVRYASLELIDEKENLLIPSDEELSELFHYYIRYCDYLNHEFVNQLFSDGLYNDPKNLSTYLEKCRKECGFFDVLLLELGKQTNLFKTERISLSENRGKEYLKWLSTDGMLEELDVAAKMPQTYQAILNAKTLNDLKPFVEKDDWVTLNSLPRVGVIVPNTPEYQILSTFLNKWYGEDETDKLIDYLVATFSVFPKFPISALRATDPKKLAENRHEGIMKIARKTVLSYVASQHLPALCLKQELIERENLLISLCESDPPAYGMIFSLLLLGANLGKLVGKLDKMPGLLDIIKRLVEFDKAKVLQMREKQQTDDITQIYQNWNYLYQDIQNSARTLNLSNPNNASYPDDNLSVNFGAIKKHQRLFIRTLERQLKSLQSLIVKEKLKNTRKWKSSKKQIMKGETDKNKLSKSAQNELERAASKYVNMDKFLTEITGYYRTLNEKLTAAKRLQCSDDDLLSYLGQMTGYAAHVARASIVPTKFKRAMKALIELFKKYDKLPECIPDAQKIPHLVLVRSDSALLKTLTESMTKEIRNIPDLIDSLIALKSHSLEQGMAFERKIREMEEEHKKSQKEAEERWRKSEEERKKSDEERKKSDEERKKSDEKQKKETTEVKVKLEEMQLSLQKEKNKLETSLKEQKARLEEQEANAKEERARLEVKMDFMMKMLAQHSFSQNNTKAIEEETKLETPETNQLEIFEKMQIDSTEETNIDASEEIKSETPEDKHSEIVIEVKVETDQRAESLQSWNESHSYSPKHFKPKLENPPHQRTKKEDALTTGKKLSVLRV